MTKMRMYLRWGMVLVMGCLCPGCADFELAGVAVETPYGGITRDEDGRTRVTIRAIVIGEK